MSDEEIVAMYLAEPVVNARVREMTRWYVTHGRCSVCLRHRILRAYGAAGDFAPHYHGDTLAIEE